jgi:hypothetical protein
MASNNGHAFSFIVVPLVLTLLKEKSQIHSIPTEHQDNHRLNMV